MRNFTVEVKPVSKGKKTKYTVLLDGVKVAERTTARDYTHAVLVFSGGTWGAWAFASRHDLAVKREAEAIATGRFKETVIVNLVPEPNEPMEGDH